MRIRAERTDDVDAIGRVNALAFGRPDEGDLVDRLRREGRAIASIVAEDADGALVGHIFFRRIAIATTDAELPAVALAPMAVVPGRQREGVGSALVHAGLEACRRAGERICIVVGHPEFYPRFGFSAGFGETLDSVYRGPAFMALELTPGALAGVRGRVRYPAAFEGL